jgi:hypothetical protein
MQDTETTRESSRTTDKRTATERPDPTQATFADGALERQTTLAEQEGDDDA